MGQVRVGDAGVDARKQKIAAWEQQIELWKATSENTDGMNKLREATKLGIDQVKREIEDRIKTLSFSTEVDRLDLAKLRGRLDGLESVYYDIADASKKIEGVRTIIAKLAEEIKRSKKGELIETRA